MQKENYSNKDYIEIFTRPVDWNNDNIPEGPCIHTVFRDSWDGLYHDHVVIDNVIHIVSGDIQHMSKAGYWYFTNKNPKPSKKIYLDRKLFLDAIAEFGRLTNDKPYQILNFKTNCIAFRRFVMKKVG